MKKIYSGEQINKLLGSRVLNEVPLTPTLSRGRGGMVGELLELLELAELSGGSCLRVL